MMPADAAVQEFDAATNTDKAKKLTANLSHTEAEKSRLGRQCEAVKVRATLTVCLLSFTACSLNRQGWLAAQGQSRLAAHTV